MKIKFVDLCAQNQEVHERVEHDLADLHRKAAYVGGEYVQSFEAEFAAFLGVKRAIGVGSGTDALRLTLLALGVGVGDEVITTPMTFIATTAAILQTGATPVFVDIDAETGNLDPRAVQRYLAAGRFRAPNGPKAILPVHLYGSPAAVDALAALAREGRLHLVEDACQAHGARVLSGQHWRSAGSFGVGACFSFYPGKNLGAWGEAGAVVTDDDDLADQVVALRDHGRISHYAHDRIGYNARLDALQAVVLRAKLARLPDWNARRREIAGEYRELLRNSGVSFVVEPEGAQSCYHLFVVRSEARDRIRQELLSREIECGIHYPVPVHLQPACSALGYKPGDFPISERFADTIVSLPMHPHLRSADLVSVTRAVYEALDNRNSALLAGGHRPSDSVAPPLANGN
jgi:dTDP-4-amino-4,6-dideoxygalactose transaminase